MSRDQYNKIVDKLFKLNFKEQFKILHTSEDIPEFINCSVMQKTSINDAFSVKYHKYENVSPVRISVDIERHCFILFS
jgi:hypothetical protein